MKASQFDVPGKTVKGFRHPELIAVICGIIWGYLLAPCAPKALLQKLPTIASGFVPVHPPFELPVC